MGNSSSSIRGRILLDELKKLADGNNWLSKATLVVKAHEALGSRFKLGLVKVDLDLRGAQAAAKEMLGRQVGSITVTQVIVSEMVPHKEEYYAAVKSTRDGADVLIASCGGVEVESNWDRVKKLTVEVEGAIPREACRNWRRKPVLWDDCRKSRRFRWKAVCVFRQ